MDYIRKTNIVDREAGGITQHIGAYEVLHELPSGQKERITFLDTPGHEAFSKMRSRGAKIADIVILVIAADDGVNVQTKEAIKTIREAGVSFIVAINKIDKPNANIEKIKQELASNEIFLEGYGGKIPNVAISAKTGQGISELLDTILLMTDMENLLKNDDQNAEGIVVESNLDSKKGNIATLIIKNGALKVGSHMVVDDTVSPVRMMINSRGEKIKEANASSPVQIMGFSKLPQIGSTFNCFENKKEAENAATKNKISTNQQSLKDNAEIKAKLILPILIKADFLGSLEAIEKEIKKLENEEVKIKILGSGVGNINENDIKIVGEKTNPIIIGFNVKMEKSAMDLAEKMAIDKPQIFSIIYNINKYLEEKIKERMPKVLVEEIIGKAQILKVFSENKDKRIVGGKVYEGVILPDKTIKIIRQQKEIARGQILSLQMAKTKAKEIKTGEQFGMMVESKISIAQGDIIEIIDLIAK